MNRSLLRAPLSAITLALLATTMLSACSGVDSKAEYPDADRDRLYRYGSLAGGEGGFDILGNKGRRDNAENSGIGVNSFLWRAALDTVSFMPLASADPFGGVIITDWYQSPTSPNERTKAQVYVLSRELRADAIKATIFRQVQDSRGNWKDAPVAEDSARKLEDAMLTRARQIRQANIGS